ncbi:MAG: hypothetical protein NWP47_04775, partial [Rickettsiaceae bacterium]|nr:hypothetical protein [Rickettsiaceae bacterium]
MKLKYKALLLATVSINALNAMAVAVNVTGWPTINPAIDYPAATQFNIGNGANSTFIGDLNVPMVFGAHYNSEHVTFQNQIKISAPITVLGNHSGAIFFANDGAILNDNIGDNINRLNAIVFTSNAGGSTVEPGKEIYVNLFYTYLTDSSVLNSTDIKVDTVTQFNDNSALTFNDSNLNSSTLNIVANSSPTFNNGTIIASTNFVIHGTSSPNFNGVNVTAPNGINIGGSPTITLGEGFTLDTQFNIMLTATPNFKGKISEPIRFGVNSIGGPAKFLQDTTITAPITTLTNNIGKLYFAEDNITINANLGDNTNKLYSVNFSSNSGTTAQAGKTIYTKYFNSNNQDASIINADITVSDTVSIIDNSTMAFNDSTINTVSLDIAANSSPAFNSGTINSTNFTISDTSSPTFNGVQVTAPNGINVEDSPTITLNEGFTLDTKFKIKDNAMPTFEGTLVPPVE